MRKYVVPGRPEQKCTAVPGHMRTNWAELMKRVFAIDVLKCPKCGRRMEMSRRAAPKVPPIVAFLDRIVVRNRGPPFNPAVP